MNPAVTLADAAVGGIRWPSCLGRAAATLLFRWLAPALPKVASDIVVPHPAKQEEA